jgi:hypothetical protein
MWPQARLFGVVLGTPAAPRVAYLDRPVPVDEERVVSTAPADPGEVLRISAPCAAGRCTHFRDDRCQLVRNVIELLPAVTTDLPICAIRSHCVWFKQEGRGACMRCPQVVTHQPTADPVLQRVAETGESA